MSSTMANAARKILSPLGARGATSARTPSAKAMSVAMGIAHPRASIPPAVRQEIDRSGDRHPADRAGDRQRRLARGRQFARQHLAFDLQPDQEKEDRHQPVVDPLMER